MEACDWAANSEYIADHDVIVYSDSAYVINCFKDKWFINWENNGWKNAKGDTIANLLEWRFLIKFFKMPNFNFEKIKGHSGHIHNERADYLAQGKAKPEENFDLTNKKINDIINIELSELLLKYSMKKITTKETIKTIMDIIEREKNYE
jgi:ribonuclease HI